MLLSIRAEGKAVSVPLVAHTILLHTCAFVNIEDTSQNILHFCNFLTQNEMLSF